MKYLLIFSSLILTFCTTKVEIKPFRNFEIPYNDEGNRDFNYTIINGKQYFLYIDKTNKKLIYVRDVESNKLIYTVPLTYILKNLPSLDYDLTSECISFHSLDSIYILASGDIKIFLIDTFGQIKKEFNVTKKIFPENIPYVLQAFWNAPFFEINKNEFICRTIKMINVGSKEGRLAYYNIPTVGKIKIKGDSVDIENLNVYFPYEIRKSGEDYNFVSVQYSIGNNNEIVYSFLFSPYIFKLSTTNELDSFVVKSRFFTQNDIIPIDSISYFKDMYSCTIEYNAKTPFYTGIHYNPFQNTYYRIAKHSKKYKNSDGTINKAENWSIIFLNEDFKILDEIDFLNDTVYDWSIIIPTKKGFIIGMQQTDEDKENEKLRLCEFEVNL